MFTTPIIGETIEEYYEIVTANQFASKICLIMKKILLLALLPVLCNAQESLSDQQLAAYYVKSNTADKSIVSLANKILGGKTLKENKLEEFYNATKFIQESYSFERKKLRSQSAMGSRYESALSILDKLTSQYKDELAKNEKSDITDDFIDRYFRPIACSQYLDLRDIVSFIDLSKMYYTAKLGELNSYSTQAPSLAPSAPNWTIKFVENKQLCDSCMNAFQSRDYVKISKDMFERTLAIVEQINRQHKKNLLIESGEWDAYKQRVAQATEYIKSLNIPSEGEYVQDLSRLPGEIYKRTIPYVMKDGKTVIHGTVTERHILKQVANPIPAKGYSSTFDYTKSATYVMGKLISEKAEGTVTYWHSDPEFDKIRDFAKRMEAIRKSPVIINYSESVPANLASDLNNRNITREEPDELLISQYALDAITFEEFMKRVKSPYIERGTY